jgi:hypothetical protein
MHTICFHQHGPFYSASVIVDDAVVPLYGTSILVAYPGLRAHVSVMCISVLCITCVGISYGVLVYVLTLW